MDSADSPQADLPTDVAARVPLAMARAQEKVLRLQPNPAEPALLKAAQSARTARQRVVWMHRWASAWAEPFSAVSACARGCDHCCHLAVPVASSEARLIAEATGRAAASPTGDARMSDEDWKAIERAALGTPCPFLRDQACSIYSLRPFACRTHISLDDDDLLCRLVPGVAVPVPYADATRVVAHFLMSFPSDAVADIRAFFPPP